MCESVDSGEPNHKRFLYDGGYLRMAGEGLDTCMPLGWRVVQNISGIIRNELNQIDGQEIHLPFVMPYTYLEKSGRADLFNNEVATFKDRTGMLYALSPTQEESMTEQIKNSISNYNDLPLLLYQFQSKYRDIPHIEDNLLQTKEFLLCDAYSYHLSFTGLNNFVPKVFSAFNQIFKKCGIEVISGEGGTGLMGGEKAFEFLAPHEHGDQEVLICKKCHYAANKLIAKGIKQSHSENPKPLKEIEEKEAKSIEALASKRKMGLHRFARTTVYRLKNGFIMTVVRADYHLSLEKLSQYLQETVVRKATESELEMLGLSSNASPIGNEDKIKVLVDETVVNSANLIMGSNKENHWYFDCNFGVDFEADNIVDIAILNGTDLCSQCGNPFQEKKVIEVGKIFKVGDFYTRQIGLILKNEKGRKVNLHMGSYRIGMTQFVAAIADQNSDENGLIWPVSVAPFCYFLIGIGSSLAVKRETEKIYLQLKDQTLLDDRKIEPEQKKKDAELLGIPFQIVLSEELLNQGKVEITVRRTGEVFQSDLETLVETLSSLKEEPSFYND